jgi:hypothetical protein
LGKAKGITDAHGCYRTTYSPPVISGIYAITSTISNYSSNKDFIAVWVPNLYRLLPGENYRLNGGIVDCNVPDSSCDQTDDRKAHPSNHWGVREVVDNLPKIANAFKSQFYGNGNIPPLEMVHFNDMSLEWGGKFDLNRNWLEGGSHGEHNDGRRGIDTRSKNIPDPRHDTLMQIFNDIGFAWNDERNTKQPHWHLRWNYRKSDGTLWNKRGRVTVGELQNGIDPNNDENTGVYRTPTTLTHSIGEAIFERPVTQDEFEVWSPQLTNAKAQGSNVFLQEVKTFEKQLFASQEYIARQRTDEQFVQDVFASHLFREPTTPELTYWLDYLANIGGTQEVVTDPNEPNPGRTRTTTPLSQQQKRQMFLNYFQTLPDFVNMVASVVDDTYQEPPH